MGDKNLKKKKKEMYWNQKAAVRMDGERWVEVKREVRHRCELSPDLFSLYEEIIMREIEYI